MIFAGERQRHLAGADARELDRGAHRRRDRRRIALAGAHADTSCLAILTSMARQVPSRRWFFGVYVSR